MNTSRSRCFVAEGIGTGFLLAAVVGSGIMADRLAGGNQAIALLANAVGTGAALVALILTFGPVSGAHFNPVVTIADASQGGIAWREVPEYVCAQFAGAMCGVWTAHFMFEERIFMLSTRARSGPAQIFSKFVATFGLLAVIWGCSRRRSPAVPFAVAAYITPRIGSQRRRHSPIRPSRSRGLCRTHLPVSVRPTCLASLSRSSPARW
jgi:glycerol uptake facilitator-like aquaporin